MWNLHLAFSLRTISDETIKEVILNMYHTLVDHLHIDNLNAKDIFSCQQNKDGTKSGKLTHTIYNY
jgi:hypothetical protein